VHANGLAAAAHAFGAAVEQVGGNRNLVPVEVVSLIIFIALLPRAVVEHADAPLAHTVAMLFLAGHLAGVAAVQYW
jgi:hypothetical protein